MDLRVSRNEGEGKRQLIERTRANVERLAFETEPCRHRQEGRFIETGGGNRHKAANVGFADRPADLLGNVEQGPHEGIDTETPRIIPSGLLKAAVLEGSHSPRVSEIPLDSIL